ncbi:MAG: endonuclease III [Phycisphaerae bacterium]
MPKAATAHHKKKASSTKRVPRELQAARRARAAKILDELHRLYPKADCALTHRSALQLLVGTILSAQCTDVRVNIVTVELFKRYRRPADYADADPRDLEKQIQSTGFFRNKTKNLIGMGSVLRERFAGRVPDTMEKLLELPGVARKTANCVLGTWFKKNEGVVVDTHIGRLARRLALTWTSRDDKDAVHIEQDLMKVLPRDAWTFAGHALIWHGRRVCKARSPNCAECTLANHCPAAYSFPPPASERRKA